METLLSRIKKKNNSQYLYRFQKCDYVRIRSALKSQLFFSNINSFNDPYEFVHLPVSMQDKNIEAWKRHIKSKKNNFSDDEIENFLRNKNLSTQTLALGKKILSNAHSICCFSIKENNNLLWSHYADSHKGWCLIYGFNFWTTNDGSICVKLNKEIAFFQGVEYTNDWPVYDISNNETSLKILYTKSEDWAHEEECRLIIRNKSQHYTIPKFSLKGIIFGLRMNNKKKHRLKQLFKNNNFSLDYYHAAIKMNSYEMEIIPDHMAIHK